MLRAGIGDHAYDCGTLSRVLEDIGKLGRVDKHVVICCTVLPGYIAQVAATLLEGCAGCTISYNPEFIAQGDIMAGKRWLHRHSTARACTQAAAPCIEAAAVCIPGSGRTHPGLAAPDLVLIGEGSSAAGERLQAVHERASANRPRVCRMSPASAEIAKLALNCFVTTKISFANMISARVHVVGCVGRARTRERWHTTPRHAETVWCVCMDDVYA